MFRIELDTRSPHGSNDSSPVGILTEKGGLDQTRIGNRTRHFFCIFIFLGAAYPDGDAFARPFTVFDEGMTLQARKDKMGGGKGGGATMGFTFRLADDPAIDRTRIAERIKAHEFDHFVYGGISRADDFLEEVTAAYSPQDVIFVDGEDIPLNTGVERERYRDGELAFTKLAQKGHMFIREMKDGCPEDTDAWIHETVPGHWVEDPFYMLPRTGPGDWMEGIEG